MLFGGHVSGGVKAAPERAKEIGAEALQLFVQSPRAWRFPNHDPEVLAGFAARTEDAGIGSTLVHAIYLCNFASPDDELYAKSVSTLESTVDSRSWPDASSRARNCSVVRPVNGTDALWRTIEEAISRGAAAIAE